MGQSGRGGGEEGGGEREEGRGGDGVEGGEKKELRERREVKIREEKHKEGPSASHESGAEEDGEGVGKGRGGGHGTSLEGLLVAVRVLAAFRSVRTVLNRCVAVFCRVLQCGACVDNTLYEGEKNAYIKHEYIMNVCDDIATRYSMRMWRLRVTARCSVCMCVATALQRAGSGTQ